MTCVSPVTKYMTKAATGWKGQFHNMTFKLDPTVVVAQKQMPCSQFRYFHFKRSLHACFVQSLKRFKQPQIKIAELSFKWIDYQNADPWCSTGYEGNLLLLCEKYITLQNLMMWKANLLIDLTSDEHFKCLSHMSW